MMLISLGMNIVKHGEEKPHSKYDVLSQVKYLFFLVLILYYGGFWDVFFK